ncbi:pyrroline-5-carboxylate reductase dimerization domain-containing protein [Sphingomonas sp.]|uniref:pyrroline-5-carboxylate reductase family protein n=1 Tax=Sphingomonas sp. TaxID=28214 RepID=UPI0017E7D562|nr:pyrroline-5-carboxylate reductase dimerization domain-containing protein [Sphingomonas sp.]MBA3511455.1 NAD(P)-binding domain-containing protein [Sphingomonas sp.]
MVALPTPSWFVGCGNMAGAMVEGWRSGGVDLSGAVAIRPSGEPVEGVRTVKSMGEAGEPPKLAVLGFKPQKLDEVAPEFARLLTEETVVVSILAGVEAATLRTRFLRARSIVRAAPNLPVSIRRGVIALYSDDAEDSLRTQLSELAAMLGYAVWTNSEATLAAIGSVAGAGPAYAARFIAALAKAGQRRGLPDSLAATIALETVLGTAWLGAASREPMDGIARRVASPNGTTEAGLAVLDPHLDNLIAATIDAAARRSAELAEEAADRSS